MSLVRGNLARHRHWGQCLARAHTSGQGDVGGRGPETWHCRPPPPDTNRVSFANQGPHSQPVIPVFLVVVVFFWGKKTYIDEIDLIDYRADLLNTYPAIHLPLRSPWHPSSRGCRRVGFHEGGHIHHHIASIPRWRRTQYNTGKPITICNVCCINGSDTCSHPDKTFHPFDQDPTPSAPCYRGIAAQKCDSSLAELIRTPPISTTTKLLFENAAIGFTFNHTN